ncbi:MAG: hypothetical protein AB1791_12650 [Chloroflexota bacterium]
MSQMPVPPAVARIAPDGNLTPRQMRHFLIELARRRVQPGTGSGVEFMLTRTALNPWPDLRTILKGIRWAIIGGVATRAYMPERATKDMDVLVHQRDEDEVVERLRKAGYTIESELAVPGYLMRSPEGVELDVLFGRYPWLNEALANPEYDPAGYPVLGLPYLIIMKMKAGRGRDVGDLTTMLGWASDDELTKVREIVARYIPEDLEDLESLIFIGRKEMETPPQMEE